MNDSITGMVGVVTLTFAISLFFSVMADSITPVIAIIGYWFIIIKMFEGEK